MSTGSRVESLIAGFVARRSDDALEVDVSEALQRALESGRQAWPDVELDPRSFGEHLATRLAKAPSPFEALERLHTDDLYLARACAAHDRAALAVFESRFVPEIGPSIAHISASAAILDEVEQTVRTEVLVGRDDGVPTILSYAGTGPLRSWVAVVAVRMALRLVRADRRRADGAERVLDQIVSPVTSPELRVLKERSSRAFSAAVRDTLAELSSADRSLLRNYYVHKLTVDQLGRLLGIHRSNAARRLTRVRESVRAAIRRRMLASLKLGKDDVAAMARMIESRLDLSIGSCLRTKGEGSTEPEPEPSGPD